MKKIKRIEKEGDIHIYMKIEAETKDLSLEERWPSLSRIFQME